MHLCTTLLQIAGNKCFQIVELSNQEDDGLNWEEALAACRSQSVDGLRDIDLATLSNAEENGVWPFLWINGKPWKAIVQHKELLPLLSTMLYINEVQKMHHEIAIS